jgi:hypothetical protein
MDTYAVFVEGLQDLGEIEGLDDKIALAAVRSINKIARDGRVAISREIRRQVNLPASYLSPSGGRLAVSRQATKGNLEAAITARGRATSLARFSSGGKVGKEGVSVSVSPGRSVTLKRAFLIRLRSGTANLDTQANLGLAVRLRPGETLRSKYAARRMASGLYLLYGPSVAQVFLDNSGKGVASDMTPEILDNLEIEFGRQMSR